MFMLSQKDNYSTIVRKAKQKAKLKDLKELRRSNPQPAMVSTLDLEQLSSSSGEEEGSGMEKGTREETREEHADSNEVNPGPSTPSHPQVLPECQQCTKLQHTVRHLKRKLAALQNKPCSSLTPKRKKYEQVKMDQTTRLPQFGK